MVETRIAEIEDILMNAEEIVAKSTDKVHLGSTVELKSDAKTSVYTLVGPVEADPLEGKISDESPIGVALMGKAVGEKVTITTPKGSITYSVVAIS